MSILFSGNFRYRLHYLMILKKENRSSNKWKTNNIQLDANIKINQMTWPYHHFRCLYDLIHKKTKNITTVITWNIYMIFSLQNNNWFYRLFFFVFRDSTHSLPYIWFGESMVPLVFHWQSNNINKANIVVTARWFNTHRLSALV